MLDDFTHHPSYYYLANFRTRQAESKNSIWVYRRGSSEITLTSLSAIAPLGREIEESKLVLTNTALRSLISGQSLSNVERTSFAEFLAAQWLRIRLSRHNTQTETHSQDAALEDSATYVEALVQMVSQMKWSLRTTDEYEPLVTSDSPVILNNPTVVQSVFTPTPLAYEVIFPICPTLLLIATWDGHAGGGPMSPRVVHQINRLISYTAETFVYASRRIHAISRYLLSQRQELIHPHFPQ